MAQIATTHDKKPADQPRTNADRAADLARDARDQVASWLTMWPRPRPPWSSARPPGGCRRQLARSVPMLGTPPEPGNDFADFWRELASAQLADNLDAFSKLAAARTWQERMRVQRSFISGSIARMGEVSSGWLQLTGAAATRQLTTSSREAKTVR